MEEMWLARNKSKTLVLFESKPLKDKYTSQWILGGRWMSIPNNWFPEVQWSDKKPTKVKLVIDM